MVYGVTNYKSVHCECELRLTTKDDPKSSSVLEWSAQSKTEFRGHFCRVHSGGSEVEGIGNFQSTYNKLNCTFPKR